MLYRMEGRRPDERSWKPNLLVLSGSPAARWYLIELADAIAQSRSLVTVAAFVSEEHWTSERVRQVTESIRAYLRKREVPAFIRTMPAADPFEGATTMVRSYGFGPIVPNTVLIGDTEQASNFVGYAKVIQLIARSRRNLIIVRQASVDPQDLDEPRRRVSDRRIDLWWGGKSSRNSAFMLAVAILLMRSDAWARAKLHVKTVVDSEAEQAEAVQRLERFLAEARIAATTRVIVRGGKPAFDVIRESSRDSELVFLGVRSPAEDESADAYSTYYRTLLERTEGLSATALVMAGEDVDFLRIFQDQ
jgi:hypothetical protein